MFENQSVIDIVKVFSVVGVDVTQWPQWHTDSLCSKALVMSRDGVVVLFRTLA